MTQLDSPRFRRPRRRLLPQACGLALLLLLGGCVSRPLQQQGGPASSPAERVAPPASRPAADAIHELLEEGREQVAAADWQGAIASAERGLRIDRREAELYLLLAQSYRALGQPERARQFASQGLRYVADGGPVAAELNRLLSAPER